MESERSVAILSPDFPEKSMTAAEPVFSGTLNELSARRRPMEWREWLLTHFGPGLLGGIAFRDWLGILRERRWAIAPSCLPRAVAITFQSLQNSLLGLYERRRFGPELERISVEPPLFVLGHWRSGTS